MKKKILISLNPVFALILTAATAIAWGPGLGRGLVVRQEVGCPDLPILGEKQFHKVQALQEMFLREIESLQRDLLAKKTELRILELAPIPDPTAVKAKREEILNLRAKLREKTENHRLEIWKILNPEQRTQFDVRRPGMRFNSRVGWGPTSG